MKNQTVVLKTSKFEVLNVIRYIVLYKLQQKTLTFCHRDWSFSWYKNCKDSSKKLCCGNVFKICKISIYFLHCVNHMFFLISVHLFVHTRWFLACTCTTRHDGSRLRCLTCTLKERRRKIRNEASQKRWEKWKRGYFKSREKALQNGMRITPILQVSPKLQGFEN